MLPWSRDPKKLKIGAGQLNLQHSLRKNRKKSNCSRNTAIGRFIASHIRRMNSKQYDHRVSKDTYFKQ